MDHILMDLSESLSNGALDRLTRLDDRRKMESGQELSRINQMGKVHQALKAGNIARNVLTKIQNGPLGDPSEGVVQPPSRKNSRDMHSGGLSKEEAKQMKLLSNSFKASRNEELESLRNMKLVQAGREDKGSRKRARRLFNHRVFVNAYQNANDLIGEYRKGGILLTQSEVIPDRTEASDFIRQESQQVINNFFKIPSRRQRVLQRLNSEGKHNVLPAAFDEQHDGQDEPMGKQPVQKAEEKSKKGQIRSLRDRIKKPKFKKLKKKRWSGGKWTRRLKTKESSEFQEIVSVVDTSNKRAGHTESSHSHYVVTKQHSKKHAPPLSPIPPSPPIPPPPPMSSWTTLPPSFGFSAPPPPPSKAPAPPPIPPESGSPSKSPSPPKMVSVSPPSADAFHHNSPFSAHPDGLPNGECYFMDTIVSQEAPDCEISGENDKDTEFLLMSTEQYEEHILFEQDEVKTTEVQDSCELEFYEVTEVKVDTCTHVSETAVTSHQLIEDDGSPSRSEDDTEDTESTAADGEQAEGDKEPSSLSSLGSQPRYKRYFSSPQLSVTLPSPSESTSIFDSHVMCPHQPTPTHHGYYTPLSVDVNPFDFTSSEDERKKRVMVDQDTPVGLEDNADPNYNTLPRVSKPKTRQYSVTEEAKDKEIPAHAFSDPNFKKFVKNLGRDPVLQDYISFKLCMIGDEIDQKYDAELNIALDDVLMDIIKSSISWQNFCSVSKRLLLEGQRVQDGLFMITCFGRRLSEVMPQLGETITYYTERMMDQYAADILLSVGGWNTLMESYSQVEVYEDEYPDLYDEMQGPMCTGPDSHLYGLDIPPIIVEEPTSHRGVPPKQQQHTSQQPPPPPPPNNQPFTSPASYCLRRTVSVEVLFQETESDSNTTPKIDSRKFSLPRSLSTSSLDTLTPGTATFFDYSSLGNGGVFHYQSQLSKTEKRIQRDQVITVETVNEECYFQQRQHSRQSSFSSVTSVNIVGNMEIVSRGGGRIHTPAATSSSEELPDFFLSPSPSRSNTLGFRSRDLEERDSRHSVALKIAVPIATVVVALGAVALGYWYLSRKK